MVGIVVDVIESREFILRIKKVRLEIFLGTYDVTENEGVHCFANHRLIYQTTGLHSPHRQEFTFKE